MDLGSHITKTPSSKGLRVKGDMQGVAQEENGVAGLEQTLTPLWGGNLPGALLVGYKRERECKMGQSCMLVRGWTKAGHCRDHHGADHVHHHHGRERLHAPRVLHQGRGHLPLGQLCVRVPLGAGVRGRQLPDHRAGAEGAEAAGEGERSFIHFLVGVHAAGWMRIAGSREKGDVCAKGGGSISEYSSFYHNGSQKVASLWTKTRKTWVLDLSSATSFGPQFPHLF